MKTQISLFEVAVADGLRKRGWDVFAAIKDRGVDLVAFPSLEDGDHTLRIQVKGSRSYAYEPRFQGWFNVKLKDLTRGLTDVWVFVCFVPAKRGQMEPQFATIRTAELLRRLQAYAVDRHGIVDLYLTEHNGRLIDDRGLARDKLAAGQMQMPPERDYTKFWGLDELLKGQPTAQPAEAASRHQRGLQSRKRIEAGNGRGISRQERLHLVTEELSQRGHTPSSSNASGPVMAIDDPVMLIRINRSYRPGMSADELYEATRRAWRLGKRRETARFACAVFKGVVREVYEIGQWRKASPREGEAWKGERWEFVGKIAGQSVRSKYLGRRVESYFPRGSIAPIIYVNCYEAKPADIGGPVMAIDDPVMLIRINKLYRPGMSPDELYEATRRAWRAGKRRETAGFACAVFESVVREVYEIGQWRKVSPREGEAWNGDRWEFDGKIADESIRSKYLGCPVKSYFRRGAQNPIKYVNC